MNELRILQGSGNNCKPISLSSKRDDSHRSCRRRADIMSLYHYAMEGLK